MKRVLFVLFLLVTLGFGLGGCSSSRDANKPDGFSDRGDYLSSSRQFQKSFAGNLADLALARDSGHTLISSIPDSESGGKHRLTLLDDDGEEVFEKDLSSPIRNLAISADGSFIAIQQYEKGVTAFDAAGKKRFSVDAACKPIVLSKKQQLLCVYDDETQPKVAFDVYDWSGKRVARFPIKTDVLAWKVSEDENWILIAQTFGKITLINSEFKIVKQYQVKGEVLDVAVSSATEPNLAVLHVVPSSGQSLTLLNFKGDSTGAIRPEQHLEQVEMDQGGKHAFAYGNSPKGQYLAAYSVQNDQLLWRRREARFADYSLKIDVRGDVVVLGLEDEADRTRRSRILILDFEGRVRSELPIETKEGAYLYHFSYSSKRSLLAVGSDDRQLQVLSLD